MLFSASLPVALYWFNNEGIWYLHVNLYLGERIMYLSFAFEIAGFKFKKLDDNL